MRLLKLADLLDLVHEVASVDILHDEIESVLVGDNKRVKGKSTNDDLKCGCDYTDCTFIKSVEIPVKWWSGQNHLSM